MKLFKPKNETKEVENEDKNLEANNSSNEENTSVAEEDSLFKQMDLDEDSTEVIGLPRLENLDLDSYTSEEDIQAVLNEEEPAEIEDVLVSPEEETESLLDETPEETEEITLEEDEESDLLQEQEQVQENETGELDSVTESAEIEKETLSVGDTQEETTNEESVEFEAVQEETTIEETIESETVQEEEPTQPIGEEVSEQEELSETEESTEQEEVSETEVSTEQEEQTTLDGSLEEETDEEESYTKTLDSISFLVDVDKTTLYLEEPSDETKPLALLESPKEVLQLTEAIELNRQPSGFLKQTDYRTETSQFEKVTIEEEVEDHKDQTQIRSKKLFTDFQRGQEENLEETKAIETLKEEESIVGPGFVIPKKRPKKKEEPTKNIEEEAAVPKLPETKTPPTQEEIEKKQKRTSKWLLRRQKRANKARIEDQTQQLTQNLQTVDQEEALIFATLPENLISGGVTLFNNLVRQMQKSGSLRVETLMSVLGALAGYSTQAAVREKMVKRMGIQEEQVFSIIQTANGNQYYFGDALERALQRDKHSVWYLSASATMRLSGKVESNIDEILRYSIRNLGKDEFGVPRLPKNIKLAHLPQYYVEHMWDSLVPGLNRFTDDPMDWPIIFGVALQRALICTRNILDTNTSLKIILESAVPMSLAKITPIIPDTKKAEKEIRDQKIAALRTDIEVIREKLSGDIKIEERMKLVDDISLKTEKLYKLISEKEIEETKD